MCLFMFYCSLAECPVSALCLFLFSQDLWLNLVAWGEGGGEWEGKGIWKLTGNKESESFPCF